MLLHCIGTATKFYVVGVDTYTVVSIGKTDFEQRHSPYHALHSHENILID